MLWGGNFPSSSFVWSHGWFGWLDGWVEGVFFLKESKKIALQRATLMKCEFPPSPLTVVSPRWDIFSKAKKFNNLPCRMGRFSLKKSIKIRMWLAIHVPKMRLPTCHKILLWNTMKTATNFDLILETWLRYDFSWFSIQQSILSLCLAQLLLACSAACGVGESELPVTTYWKEVSSHKEKLKEFGCVSYFFIFPPHRKLSCYCVPSFEKVNFWIFEV